MKLQKQVGVALLSVVMGVSMCAVAPVNAAAPAENDQPQNSAGEYSLAFNPDQYVLRTITAGDRSVTVRAYENIVYVAHPVDINYEMMNIYVPEEYYEGQSIGNYDAATAPIFFPNTVGGYMPGAPGKPGTDFRSGQANAAFVALSKGYVVAEPGARGRTTRDANGRYTGKAPACIVDLKAAVRYLHYNDKIMPGDANKIISNGTSAGGALSALLGASGNNRDYETYLQALGAADARDDIFAASCYCPITNLEHADMAYEWLFHGLNDYHKRVFPGGAMPSPGQAFRPEGVKPENMPKPVEVQGAMTDEQIALSEELKALFPSYVNSLELKRDDGTVLALDEAGNGSFKDYVKTFVIASAQQALDNGVDLSALEWITIQDGVVAGIDFEEYRAYATRMKATPAFDGVDLSNGENDLFGTATVNARHFTKFSKEHSSVDGALADADVIKVMNPMNYIGAKETNTAPHWRIRHGAVDRDTSLAIPVILATALDNKGFEVDFAAPWGKGHAGDYDLDELFSWIGKIVGNSSEK